MLKELIISIQSFFEAHQFIKKNKLWKWIVIPGLLYSILFVVGFYFFWHSSNNATAWMFNKFGVKKWLDHMEGTWMSFFFIIGQIFIHLLLLIFYFSFFKFMFLIIGSPVFAYLSEKTESIITGKDFPFRFPQLFLDIKRGISIALRNLSWQTIYMLALLIVSLIPLIGWITPLVVFFLDCYYMGFSMLDYSSERNKLDVNASIDLIGHHRGLAIGNGMVFYLLHLPAFVVFLLLGWLFTPFITVVLVITCLVLPPSYAVIAATLSLHKAKANNVIII